MKSWKTHCQVNRCLHLSMTLFAKPNGQLSGLEKEVKLKQKMIKFSWEMLSEYTMNLDEDEEWDESEEKAFEEQKQRLKVRIQYS